MCSLSGKEKLKYLNMENIKRIAEAFKGEDSITIICSNTLCMKIDSELVNIDYTQEDDFFIDKNKICQGFNAVNHEGVTIYYMSDMDWINKSI